MCVVHEVTDASARTCERGGRREMGEKKMIAELVDRKAHLKKKKRKIWVIYFK